MNLPRETLNVLKCGVCGAQLSRGPVYLQHDGAAMCSLCFTPEKEATRNIYYEALAQLHVFPCKYSEFGCEVTMPFVQVSEAIPHEEACEHRQWVCPVLGSARCDWLGPRTNLLEHFEDQHPDHVLKSPCTLQHDIESSNERTYLLRWFDFLFLLKVSVAAGKLYHSVRHLRPTGEAENFSYTIDIKRRKARVLREGEVVLQGCQEDTSLSLDINSLVSVLGGFDGAIVTVEVQRQVGETEEVCNECGAVITALVYRDDRGCFCERCAPYKRACKTEGCNHQDFDAKCQKHEWYFCAERTLCLLCNEGIERGSFFAHRSSACKTVREVGPTWRATRGLGRCLVPGPAGTALYGYNLNDADFSLYVYLPVTSERLREFRCVVSITQPATGQVRTYTPYTVYDRTYDWYIGLKNAAFPTWDCVFDISVNITKIVD